MSLEVDVVVPVYGNWSVTADCLNHLRRQTIPHRVILVDDASPDETLERVAAEFPEVFVIALDRNGGFASACNRGIAEGTGEFVVLVNNDVNADPKMLEELVGALGANDDAGSAVPLLLKPDGRVDAFGICADRTMAGFVRYNGAAVSDVSAVSPTMLGPYGAVAAYRRIALKEVGLFDEGIFMYGEELDLALRLRAAGWNVAIAKDARGVHLGGATTGKDSPKQRYLSGFGRGYLLRAYGVIGSRWSIRAAATEAVVCLFRLVRSRDTASLRGRLAGWRAGRTAARRVRPIEGIDSSIGFATALRMRSATFWDAPRS